MSFAKLSPLQIGVTKVVCSPIECGEVLVRTGMVDTKYNFIHSILFASNTDFQSLSIAEKTKEIDNIIDTIKRKTVDVVLREKFEKLATKIEWEQMVIEISKSVADYVYDKIRSSKMRVNDIVEQDDVTEKADVIFHVCKYNDIVKSVIPKAFTDANSLTIPESIVLVNKYVKVAVDATLHDKTKVFLTEDKKKMFSEFMKETFVRILTKSKNQITEKIRQNTPFNLTFDKNTLMIISNIIDRDIYLLNGDTRLPYALLFKEEMKLRKSIILMLLDDGDESGYKYFEPIGKMYAQNKISREFEHKEPIIQKIFTFLYDKAQISESLYANLLPYLDTVKTTVKRARNEDVKQESVRSLMKPENDEKDVERPKADEKKVVSRNENSSETDRNNSSVKRRNDNPPLSERYPSTSERYPPTSERYPSTSERYPPTSERYPPTSERYSRNDDRYSRNDERYPPASERYPQRNDERYPSSTDRYPPRNDDRPPSSDRYPRNDDRYLQSKYPPSSERYPPSSERYPPSSERYPPRNDDRPPSSERYPPSSERYPPSSERYPPSSERYPPSSERYQSERYPPSSEKYPSEKYSTTVRRPDQYVRNDRPASETRPAPPIQGRDVPPNSDRTYPRPLQNGAILSPKDPPDNQRAYPSSYYPSSKIPAETTKE